MIVAGVMSGTSADGINVALVRIEENGSRAASGALPAGGQACPEPSRRECPPYTVRLLGHAEYPYPKKVRAAVLEVMNSPRACVANLARLNFLLAELYAEAVLATQHRLRALAELVGCHGQTLYHQGDAAPYLGRKLAVTWQTGEGAVIAARVGVPVVSDFRPADMAAGGKGAPLVPFLDYLLYRDARVGRIVQNIGGIANLTAIPAGASAEQVIAFDTGPGNMVIDALTARCFGKPYDRGGRIAGVGKSSGQSSHWPFTRGLLSPPASEDRGPGAVWAGICAEICEAMRTGRQAGRDCYGHRSYQQIDCRCGAAVADDRGQLQGFCGLGRRGKELDPDENVGRGISAAGVEAEEHRRNSVCRRKRRKRRRLPCWLTRPGTGCPRMCQQRPERSGLRCWEKSLILRSNQCRSILHCCAGSTSDRTSV